MANNEDQSITLLRSRHIKIGTSNVPKERKYDDDEQALTIYSTCASTDASTSFEPVLINTVMTGAGQVGGRVKINMSTDVVLGGWANAFKAQVECNTDGLATGILSAGCFEIVMPAANKSGLNYTVAPLEVEINCPASSVPTSNTAFMFFNFGNDSTAITSHNTNDYWFIMGSNVNDTASGMFDAESKTGINKTHTLKIKIDGTVYYIALHTSQAFGGS